MGVQRLKTILVCCKINQDGVLGGLKLTRETPPGECSRKVKLKGIDGGLYKGWRCGLIRITRKTLPIFVSG
jgi:hypothetical protein